METIADIPVLGTLLLTVVPFLIVLGIVVFVHEFGHYIVGKWCGIRAEIFSIGFGPKLYGWTDREGTEWQIAALPLGGFVKFTGDMDPASAGHHDDSALTPEEREHAFHNAPLGGRVLTVAAGPIFNFILSIVFIAGLALAIGKPVDDPIIGELSGEAATIGFRTGDEVLLIDGQPVEDLRDIVGMVSSRPGEAMTARVRRDGVERDIDILYETEAVVTSVMSNEPADEAGIEAGDVILALDGEPVGSYNELRIRSADIEPGKPVTLTLRRDGEVREITMVPAMIERPHPVTGEVRELPTMGIGGGMQGLKPHYEEVSVFGALPYGVRKTWDIIAGTMVFIYQMFTGEADPSMLGGPIGIANIAGQAAAQGLATMVWLIAVLSTSIGLINLFPIPILDGGHLMFYTLEALRGRPVGAAAMRVGNMIGLSLVLLLMVFATYNDLLRI